MIERGDYTTEESKLVMRVLSIPFRGQDYCKAKIEILNKTNGISYGLKIWKLYYVNIEHWTPVNKIIQSNNMP